MLGPFIHAEYTCFSCKYLFDVQTHEFHMIIIELDIFIVSSPILHATHRQMNGKFISIESVDFFDMRYFHVISRSATVGTNQ